MSSLDDDLRFATEMSVAWEHRSRRAQLELFAQWTNRLTCVLLPELCRRQGLDDAAHILDDTPRLAVESFSVQPTWALAKAWKLADAAANDDDDAPHAHRKPDMVARLIDAVSTMISGALMPHASADELVRVACVRRRQLGRALRRLDDESRRILLDVSDA